MVEIGLVVQEKIFESRQCIFYHNQILFLQECFVPSLVEIGSVLVKKKASIEKVLEGKGDNDDGQLTSA